MPDQARELGTITQYSDLHRLMRERAVAIGISREVLDDLSGLPDGYSGKLLSPNPIKKMGDLALAEVLPVLGMRLVAVEDPAALEKTLSHSKYKRRNTAWDGQHNAAVSFQLSKRFFRRIGRKGGENSRKYMTRERATEIARKAGRAGAKARWAGRG
jgi:general stress protein YciG